MSPRRRIEPGTGDQVAAVPAVPLTWRDRLRRTRGLPGLAVVASLLVIAAIVTAGLMLRSHVSDNRTSARNADVLGYVGQFMIRYTTLDPFNANNYADTILADATGDFAKEFKDKQNAILIQVARAEPTKGSVLEAGIEKWHDDGSVSVLVATKIATTAGNPRQPIESGNRWVVTAVKEGQQWKISRLTQVI
ncbi:MAG: mammalian cell entry protein [Mycobacterium sp.]